MKRFIIILFLLSPINLLSQTINYNIKGTIKNPEKVKYVYLVRTKEIFSVIPVVDGKFEFKGTLPLGNELYKSAFLFVTERNNIGRDEFETKVFERTWKPGIDPNTLIVSLEEIDLLADNSDQLINAKILSGGLLTQQIKEKNTAISERKIPDFVKKHPDSPISLNAIQGTIKYFKLDIERAETRFGYPKELFALLSERLRLSTQGQLLKKEIDDVYNP